MPNSNRGGAAAAPPSPTTTTSIYNTPFGLAALTWSRALFGLALRIDLHFNNTNTSDFTNPVSFRVRPSLLWKRRGSKTFRLNYVRSTLVVRWDLSRSHFTHPHSPEPSSNYHISILLNNNLVLVAGDLVKRLKLSSSHRPPPMLLSRREHVVLGDSTARRTYRTSAVFGGVERSIEIQLGPKGGGSADDRDGGMSVTVDGERILHVRRLRWKFRGSEKSPLAAGGRIQISWDLHNWLFDNSPAAGNASPEMGHAVFVFRFEADERKDGEGHFGKGIPSEKKQVVLEGHFDYLSETTSSGGMVGKRRGRSLRKTSSSSSGSSSMSSGSSSTVMDWASSEDVELQKAEGFSLLVYAWKTKV